MSSVEASVLLSQLERLADTSSSSSSSSAVSLPSPQQVYSMGGILFQLSRKHARNNSNNSDLFLAYQHLVDSLPESFWTRVMATFQIAMERLLEKQHATTTKNKNSTNNNDMTDLRDATQSLNGLWSNAPHLCQLAYSREWMRIFAAVYDRSVVALTDDASASATTTTWNEVVLSSLSFLILDGLLLPRQQRRSIGGSTKQEEGDNARVVVEEELLHAIQAMDDQSTDCVGDLQAWQQSHEPFRRTLESAVQKLATGGGRNGSSSSGGSRDKDDDENDNAQQREYILSMLESARQSYSTRHSSSSSSGVVAHEIGSTSNAAASRSGSNARKKTPVSVAADELERRIQQVQQILPDLGEGFIETALSLHQGNVETTVAILLNDPSEYPNALRVLDRSLPRRRKERSMEEAEDAVQARQLVKGRVAAEQAQEEARYQALVYVQRQEAQDEAANLIMEQAPPKNLKANHDEYDDDYDDQYDEIDVKLGGADNGMYDFEQVKLYNQVVKETEANDSFWQNNRNTNRSTNQSNHNNNANNNNYNNNNNNKNVGGEKEWGPDKIKGGRLIGPDGKVVRKPGGARGKTNKGGGSSENNNNNNNAIQSMGGSQGNSNKNKKKDTKVNGGATGNKTGDGKPGGNPGEQQQQQKGKPRTKPKSDNRVNRQRDKKQKAQGTFGAPN